MKTALDKTIELLSYALFVFVLILGMRGCGERAAANTIKIAIMDAGYVADSAGPKLKLCKTGHYSFVKNKPGIFKNVREDHGTVVGKIIASNLKNIDYCAVIYQIYDDKKHDVTFAAMVSALDHAIADHITAINISMAGGSSSDVEYLAFARASSNGIKMFVAAGNSHQNLDVNCNVFPACYSVPNLFVVGAVDNPRNKILPCSNYSNTIRLWYPGHYFFANDMHTGTSIAAPYALSGYILSLFDLPDQNKYRRVKATFVAAGYITK
jgi:hypothetical protein